SLARYFALAAKQEPPKDHAPSAWRNITLVFSLPNAMVIHLLVPSFLKSRSGVKTILTNSFIELTVRISKELGTQAYTINFYLVSPILVRSGGQSTRFLTAENGNEKFGFLHYEISIHCHGVSMPGACRQTPLLKGHGKSSASATTPRK
ncbi:hypothetical protein CEXT_707031, partial [Caerostris extrusa]